MKKYTVRPEHYSFAYSILCRRRRVGHVLCVYPHWPKVLAQVYFVYSLIYPLPLTWHCSQNQTVGTFSKTDVTEAAESPCNNLLSPLGLISVTPDWSLLTKTSSFDIISSWFYLLHLLLFISWAQSEAHFIPGSLSGREMRIRVTEGHGAALWQ